MKIMLVYQGGIANVFRVESFNLADYGRDAVLLFQHAFEPCIAFANGCGAAGATVKTAACNRAGDVRKARWTEDLTSQPFAGSLVRVEHNTIGNIED
jgi:hypothetical protein